MSLFIASVRCPHDTVSHRSVLDPCFRLFPFVIVTPTKCRLRLYRCFSCCVCQLRTRDIDHDVATIPANISPSIEFRSDCASVPRETFSVAVADAAP